MNNVTVLQKDEILQKVIVVNKPNLQLPQQTTSFLISKFLCNNRTDINCICQALKEGK